MVSLIALEVLYVTNLYDSSDLYTVAKSYLLSNAGETDIPNRNSEMK